MDGTQIPALIALQFFVFPAAYFVWAGTIAFLETSKPTLPRGFFPSQPGMPARTSTMRERASWLFWIWIGMNTLLVSFAS